MSDTETIKDTLMATHDLLIKSAVNLSHQVDINYRTYSKFLNDSRSLLEEVRVNSPELYDQYRQDLYQYAAKMRISLRSALLGRCDELESQIRMLSTPLKEDFNLPEVSSSETIETVIDETTEVIIDQGYVVNPEIMKEVSLLIGTVVSASKILEIGGYSSANLYQRINAHSGVKWNEKKKGRGTYLLDEETIPVFFGKKRRGKKSANPRQKGKYMTAETIKEKYGFPSRESVHNRIEYIKNKGIEVQSTDNTNGIKFLVTSLISDYLDIGELILGQDLSKFLTEKLGSKKEGDEKLAELLGDEEIAGDIQIAHNTFSKKLIINYLDSKT